MHKQYSADKILACESENWADADLLPSSFAIYLHRIQQLSAEQYTPIVQKYQISPSEFDVLASLRCSPLPHVMTPTEVQRSLLITNITSGGLTKLLYQLESKGLVTRSVQEHDKRSKLIHLTDEGRERIETSMHEIHDTESATLEAALDKDEQQQLINLLGKVAREFEKRDGGFTDD